MQIRLQDMCRNGNTSTAFKIRTLPSNPSCYWGFSSKAEVAPCTYLEMEENIVLCTSELKISYYARSARVFAWHC